MLPVYLIMFVSIFLPFTAFEHLPDDLQQLIFAERFGQIVGRAEFHGFDRVGKGRVPVITITFAATFFFPGYTSGPGCVDIGQFHGPAG